MKFLAIDPGDKRTGLALGDTETRMAGPVGAIITSNTDERLRQLVVSIREHSPDALVIGLPLNMDDSEGPAAKKSRVLADALIEKIGLEVHLYDERLTSYEADHMMSQSGLTHKGKKKRRDALAATALLQDFLDNWTG